MTRQPLQQFSAGRQRGTVAPWKMGSRPALVLLHAGHGLWDFSVARLIEEIEHIDGDLLLVEARRQGSPSLEDARAAAAFLGARRIITLEVPASSRRGNGSGAESRGLSKDAERVLAAYRRALNEIEGDFQEAV